MNDVSSARKLVRLLLADPLKGKEDWEDMLDSVSEQGDLERGLLIRYAVLHVDFFFWLTRLTVADTGKSRRVSRITLCLLSQSRRRF